MTSPRSGIFRENFKDSVRAQDDFYRHVNGAWLDTAVIPEDRAVDGSFYALRDQSEERVREIIESVDGPEGSDASKIARLYRSFMDEESIENLGIAPIKAEIESALSISGLKEFIHRLGTLEAHGRAYLAPEERVRIWN